MFTLYPTHDLFSAFQPEIQYASLVYFEDFAVLGETPKLSDQLMYKTETDRSWNVGHFVLWSVTDPPPPPS